MYHDGQKSCIHKQRGTKGTSPQGQKREPSGFCGSAAVVSRTLNKLLKLNLIFLSTNFQPKKSTTHINGTSFEAVSVVTSFSMSKTKQSNISDHVLLAWVDTCVQAKLSSFCFVLFFSMKKHLFIQHPY